MIKVVLLLKNNPEANQLTSMKVYNEISKLLEQSYKDAIIDLAIDSEYPSHIIRHE